jgi:hypothetical protein
LTHVDVYHIEKEMTMKTALLSLITTLSLTTLTFAAAPVGSANVGQTDMAGWPCPSESFPPPIFSDMPIGVSLTTTGGPVLLTLSLTTDTGASSGDAFIRFSVDQQAVNAPALRWPPATQELISLARVVSVTAGVHTFGAQMACLTAGNAVTVTGWLSAYELPLIRK